MLEIDEEIKDVVEKITDKLIQFENKDNLSWMKVYKKVLNELKIENSNIILFNTVRNITNKGYDIKDDPFKLEKYR